MGFLQRVTEVTYLNRVHNSEMREFLQVHTEVASPVQERFYRLGQLAVNLGADK